MYIKAGDDLVLVTHYDEERALLQLKSFREKRGAIVLKASELDPLIWALTEARKELLPD